MLSISGQFGNFTDSVNEVLKLVRLGLTLVRLCVEVCEARCEVCEG